MKKKYILLLLMLTLTFVALISCNNKDTKNQTTSESPGKMELKKVNMGYLASPEHLLYFVAKEKGFFEEQGIDANLFLFTNSAEGLNAINAKKIDIGTFGVSAPLNFIAKGSDMKIIGGQNSGACAAVAMPENYEKYRYIKNYKGKKIATVRLSTADVIFRGALKDAGMDLKKDVEIIEMESPAATTEALKNGSVDVALIWTPYVAMAEDMGVKVCMYITDIFPNNVCCRQTLTSERLKSDPELWKNFMIAITKAYDFYKTNKAETIDITSKYVKVDKKYLEKETYADDATMECSPDPLKKSTIKFWNIMKETGFINTKVNIEDHIDVKSYESALTYLVKENPKNSNYQKLLKEFKENN